jgi:hypothetical protein
MSAGTVTRTPRLSSGYCRAEPAQVMLQTGASATSVCFGDVTARDVRMRDHAQQPPGCSVLHSTLPAASHASPPVTRRWLEIQSSISASSHATLPGEITMGAGNCPSRTPRQIVVRLSGTSCRSCDHSRRRTVPLGVPFPAIRFFMLHPRPIDGCNMQVFAH